MIPKQIKKKSIKGEYMKIKTMRSVLFLLLACLVIAGPVAAVIYDAAGNVVSEKEVWSVSCSDDSYAGLPGGNVIAVVEVSGHGDTFIDGKTLVPDGTEKFEGYPTNWYGTSPGMHTILITGSGYINFIADARVCSGKVSYVYYDQESHLAVGMTKKATTTTTVVPTTTTFDGQSTDYGAVKNALGTPTQSGNPGSLSVTTDPPGATIFIDGVQMGISPATIPGLAPGSHTLLLKLDGYQDLTLPVVISAGRTQNYSSALLKSAAAPGATAGAITTKKSSAPGFAATAFACMVGALFLFRKPRP